MFLLLLLLLFIIIIIIIVSSSGNLQVLSLNVAGIFPGQLSSYSQGAIAKKVLQKSLSFTSHDEREIPFDFGRLKFTENCALTDKKLLKYVYKIRLDT